MKRVQNFKKSSKSSRSSSPAYQNSINNDEVMSESTPQDSKQSGTKHRLSTTSHSSVHGIMAATEILSLSKVTEVSKNTSSTSDPQEAAEMLLSQNPPVETQNSQPDAMVTDSPLNSGHFMSNTAGFSGNGLGNDVPDSLPVNDVQRTKLAVTHLQQKILKISEQIKIEQNSRDDNVAEYLKLAKDADKQQAARIKSVFEKKNQKSKATIAQLQKKLENYHKRLKEIENSGSSKNQPRYLKDGLKDLRDFSGGVVDSVKGGLSGLSQVTQTAAGAIVSKPKEMASKIKNKFGSADNISSLKDDEDSGGNIRFGSADDVSVATSAGSADYLDTQAVPSNQLSLISTVTTLKSQMSSLRQDCANFSDFRDNLRAENSILQEELEKFKLLPRNIDMLTNSLQDERYRCSRLEDQLHDLSEMHHRELSDLKQEISSLEEKFEYHALERARDIQEALEACQTRISKMEVQQQHQHQQLVTMEGVENANARALLGKLINLLLSVLAVILVFVSTASSIVRPVVRTQTRMAITLVCVVCLVLLYRNLDALTKYWSNR